MRLASSYTVDSHRLPNVASVQFNHNALGDAYTTEACTG